MSVSGFAVAHSIAYARAGMPRRAERLRRVYRDRTITSALIEAHGAPPAHRREAGCSCGWTVVDDSGDDGIEFAEAVEDHFAWCQPEPAVSGREDER